MTLSTFGVAISPVYYMNRVIGLAPYSRNKNSYTPSRWASIYTVILMCCYWLIFGAMVHQNIEDTNGDLSVRTTTTYLQISLGCATQTICWICAIFLQNWMTTCYNLMNITDIKLKKIQPDCKYQVNYLCKYSSVFVVFS